MEVIRKFVDANSLMSILALPEAFRNRKLEIIVLPAGEDAPARRNGDVADIVRSLWSIGRKNGEEGSRGEGFFWGGYF